MRCALFWGGRGKRTIMLEGSQALPTRPSDKGAMKLKALKWPEIVA
jgi:hypothetical protein